MLTRPVTVISSKDRRYARTAEYMQILRLAWTSPEPFDFEGEFYQVKDVRHGIRPYHGARHPALLRRLVCGGAGCRGALRGPVRDVRRARRGHPGDDCRRLGAGSGTAASSGFSVSLRPILGDTEDAAWERAHRFLEIIQSRKQAASVVALPARCRRCRALAGRGSTTALRAAAQGDVRDTRLWMAIARETGANANTTAPVGTPDQVAETIMGYVEPARPPS